MVCKKILVVDDSADTRELLKRNLETGSFKVFLASDVPEAVGFLDEMDVDIVITDYKMPGMNGMKLVRHIRQNFKKVGIIMITGYATIDGAVEAVKSGAAEYITKPFTAKELFTAIDKAFEKVKAVKSSDPAFPGEKFETYGLIGRSEPMLKVYETIKKASLNTATVLINGESGTGKELVARAIHYNSDRSSAHFVPVNCGGVPEGLLESELFGYVKGAFTGASDSRKGFFETAENGTIFLDEISEAPLAMQVKLLRVLQSREICMVGDRKVRRVDIRIIAATNKDILSLVKKGNFREDLFFRLNVINVTLPPLRERGDDIFLLTEHFIDEYSRKMNVEKPDFTERALEAMKHYSWPGNVRELENSIQRTVVMNPGEKIDVTDLPEHMRYSIPSGENGGSTLEEIEAAHIKRVLEANDNNRSRSARILGIDRKTLIRKIKRYNVEA